MTDYSDTILTQAADELGLNREIALLINKAEDLLAGTERVLAGTEILNVDGTTRGIALGENRTTRELHVCTQGSWQPANEWTTLSGIRIAGVLLGEFTEAELTRALGYAHHQGDSGTPLDVSKIIQRIRDSR